MGSFLSQLQSPTVPVSQSTVPKRTVPTYPEPDFPPVHRVVTKLTPDGDSTIHIDDHIDTQVRLS